MKSLVIVTLFNILTLSLALMTLTVVTSPSVDELWALIICGYPYYGLYGEEEGMQLDPQYMHDVLVEHYPFTEVRLIDSLSYPNEDKDWLRNEIKNWLGNRSDTNDLVFIFFMTHGCKRTDGSHKDGEYDPIDEVDGIDEGLQLKEKWTMTEPKVEYYWDDELKEDIAWLKQEGKYGRLVLLLQGCKVENQTEGCFTGGFIRDVSAPNRIIITPCNETESHGYFLYPDQAWSHVGYFSRLFINALNKAHTAFDDADTNNDGIVSMWEAFQYAYANDPARIDGRETPQLDDNGDGVADIYDQSLSVGTYFGFEEIKRTDVNRNGIVWLEDIGAIQAAWLTRPGDYWWNPYVDFDNNGYINVADVSRIAKDWQKTFFPGGSTGGTRTQTETQTPELSVTPNEIIVNKHQTFSVDITITDVTDLYSYQFYLNYNSTLLNCTGVDLPPGHFLEPLEPDNILIVEQVYNNTYNATHGRLGVAATLLGDEPGKNGSGTLATINFKALAVGSTTLHFYDIVICNSVPEAMPVITVDGSVTVHPTLTVLAEDLDGNSLTTGYVYIDSQYRGRTGSNFTVSVGTHEVKVTDFWESGGTGHRYGFKNWTDGSTDNHRIINIVEDKTVTAHFKKKLCPGDVDGNGKVSSYDLFALSDAFGSRPGDPNWDSTCDLDGDGYVGSADLFILSDNFGKTYPDP